jgi:indolepyruvate ferredoxin oxidoreductase
VTPTAPALDDKFDVTRARCYLNGTQALVRLLLMQKHLDERSGHATAGFVAGYRGSPLGTFDRELWRARAQLESKSIRFWPAVNEDLAATAVWGSQLCNVTTKARVAGVFGLWYGKGAGLDRSGDAMRHAHGAGVSPLGGVLAVVGDDHAQKSSVQAYASEPTFADLLIPVLYPASIFEILHFGLLGWAMSRYTGGWVGLKTLPDYLDASTSLDVSALQSLQIVTPQHFTFPPGGVHVRWPDPWRQQELRIVHGKLGAALAFARANHIDRIVVDSPQARFGIVCGGKSYADLLQALADLGLTLARCAELGVRIYKVGMPWPLDAVGVRRFAAGLTEILVIEEKRGFIEAQLKEILYNAPDRPTITGKSAADGRPQVPWTGECNPDIIARLLHARLDSVRSTRADDRLRVLDTQEELVRTARPMIARPAYFCSGCPHNYSTRVPAGSRALGGVGCHFMATDLDRSTALITQMGGEGTPWIGHAPFTDEPHLFVNLGDGTYFHSGSLAIRACIAAGVNVTYKILFNDAVAMTGGQPIDGKLDVPAIASQLRAEGVQVIRILSEHPERFAAALFPPQTKVMPRDRLDEVQRELRAVKGVSALIFDQTCAAEKRRRRKRGAYPDPPVRTFINSDVCEACGDCSAVSNCLSVVPVQTPFGRKRAIDQSTCNKDYSCTQGFCPSFVTIEGGALRKPEIAVATELVEPALPGVEQPYNIFITGIGGTGVVTIGALLGMAAHIEGIACSITDQIGMAQKGGAVVTHARFARTPAELPSGRVPTAGANLLLGCDLPVALQDDSVRRIGRGVTRVILNTHEAITGEFIRDPTWEQTTAAMVRSMEGIAGAGRVSTFDATGLATRMTGDAIATNLIMLGIAYQQGLIPVRADSIVRAIELNGVAVTANVAAFRLGREAALRLEPALAAAAPADTAEAAGNLDLLLHHRTRWLAAYQNEAYARTFADFVAQVREFETALLPGRVDLTRAVALSLAKLMAYKDEYEVARLYTTDTFTTALAAQFTGRYKVRIHLAPPLLARRDPSTGHLRKRTFGPWIFPVFRVLTALRVLRGTPFDPFSYTAERKLERLLIEQYRQLISTVLADLTPESHELAVCIAKIPLEMRGFGHVKRASIAAAQCKQAQLLDRLKEISRRACAASSSQRQS